MVLRRTQFVALAVLVALTSVPAVAQTVTGTMKGSVIDKSGGVLPGVTVTIRNAETGLERVVVTSKDGTYNAPYLPIGRYSVVAELSGFGAMRRNNVRVDLNQTIVQDFVLDPAVTETVTVNANAPRIDVTDGEIKQTMRSEEIMALPSPNQASFLGLAAVFSGYQENPTSGQNNPTLSSGSSVNFNGTGTRGTTFQINGVNNDDSSENQNRQGVALASIKSFQILTNNYSAEFGRGYGAVVLVQTKSGTNDIDGEVYGYAQDNKNNSRPVNQVSLNHGIGYRRQYGATVGFPIMRDRLFGFFNVDNVGLNQQVTITRGMFTAADLALPRLTEGNNTPANRAWQDKIMSYWPTGISPNAPNFGTRAFQALADTSFPDREVSGRVDWNGSFSRFLHYGNGTDVSSDTDTVSVRYQRDHQIRTPGEIITGENAVQDNRQGTFGATWTGVLSSTTVQEARLGIGIRSTNVNISAGNDTPIVRINDTGLAGASFTILGNAGAYPIIRNQRDTQLVYNISSAHWDKHTLKLGTDLRKGHLNDVSDNYSRGFWTFGAVCNGNNYGTGVAAFLAGCAQQYWKGYGPFNLKNDIWEANVYGQDDWRPFDSLTLNLGLRYERVGAPKEKDHKIDYQYKTSGYVDPRLGFAYTPDWDGNRFLRALTGGSGKFAIRGGYGIFHGRVFQSIFSQGGANVRFNPPTAAFYQLTGDFSGLPGASPYNISDPTRGFVFQPGPFAGRVPGLTVINPNLKMPESRQFNLTFERQIFWQSRLRVSYIGTRGVNLLQYTFDNLPISPVYDPSSPFKVAADWLCAGTGQTINGVKLNTTTTCPNTSTIADNEISIRVPRTNDRRPNPNASTNLVVNNGSKAWYNAAQLEWETGLHAGFQGRTTYTFSKAIDEGSEATFVGTGDINIFPPNERYKKGLSRMDTRHRFTLAGTYELPWLKNRNDVLGAVLGGWQISAVARLASGNPFTIVDSVAVDVDFDGVSNLRPIVVDPAYNGGWHVNYPGNSQAKVPKSAFRRATYGDTLDDFIGRNTYYTDGFKNVDLGLYKTFTIVRGYDLMFRLDAFNVFNQVTWGYPDNNFNSTTFMRLAGTSANYNPRVLQAGFRFIY